MTYSKNVEPKFFEHWTKQQLMDECARLNMVLANVQSDIQKASLLLNEGVRS